MDKLIFTRTTLVLLFQLLFATKGVVTEEDLQFTR